MAFQWHSSFIVFYRFGIRIWMVSGRKEDLKKQLTKISHPTREVEQSVNTKKTNRKSKTCAQKKFPNNGNNGITTQTCSKCLSHKRHSVLLIHVVCFKIRQKDKKKKTLSLECVLLLFHSSSSTNGMPHGNILTMSQNLKWSYSLFLCQDNDLNRFFVHFTWSLLPANWGSEGFPCSCGWEYEAGPAYQSVNTG